MANNVTSTDNLDSSATSQWILNVQIFSVVFAYPILLGSLPYVGPAFDTAREEITQLHPKLNISHDFLVSSPECRTCLDWSRDSENALAAFYYGKIGTRPRDVTLFLIPGCDDMNGVAQFATQLDKLILSSVISAGNIADRATWPTWITTTILSTSTFARTIKNIIDLYSWRNLAIVSHANGNSFGPVFAAYMNNHFSRSSKYQIYFHTIESRTSPAAYQNLLRNISVLSRVVFYFGEATQLRQLMTTAGLQNMTNGEYVYLAFLPYRHSSRGRFAWTPAEPGTEKVAKEAFKSVIIIETDPFESKEKQDLFQSWKTRSRDVYNFTYAVNESLSPNPASTYSAMMIMAKVLDELRQSGDPETWKSGKKLANQFLNRTFSLRTGNVTIGAFGERIPAMIVTQTDVESDKIMIRLRQDPTSDRLTVINPIIWPTAQWPVLNEPRCGFRGDAIKCMQHQDLFDAGLGTIFCLILLAAAAYVFRRHASAKKILTNWWIIDPVGLSREKSRPRISG
ncbi:hypothetical protein BV898_13307 [Hypsibius exemplaris]|uniref:Receptor ligand binding region domain-containing protein n=1 Tax=Hypsibius exemplaris TaxID=2072580 RepID=A0A1W0WB58_HYPEX|nr:hypothetical protein BV898_13307 [Hypsibius exemplaris]